MPSKGVPEHLVYPIAEFAAAHNEAAEVGRLRLLESSVVFVGLARDCADPLEANLGRIASMSSDVRRWSLHIESNDCKDRTPEVLSSFCSRHSLNASYRHLQLGRERFSTEFGGRRTQALAEYRAACQHWVRQHAGDADYVVVMDFDLHGGWSYRGLLAGVGWLEQSPDAYCMASVSLAEHPTLALSDDQEPIIKTGWTHYDAWALRGVGQASCYWDNYTGGCGTWAHQYIPPVGSPPVLVSSAFGGMAVYRLPFYLEGKYDGETDCEHVSFHRSISEATGRRMYLCPSMRTVMHWYQ